MIRQLLHARTFWRLLNMLAILAVLSFIFGNSLLDGQQSSEISSGVMETIEPIARPVVEAVSPDPVSDDELHGIIRKLAHFTEFAILALLCTCLLLQYTGTWRTPYVFCVLFGTLFAAVTDEFIQSFTGRTSSVRDVLIDFSGAMCGVLATLLLFTLIQRIQKRNRCVADPSAVPR